MSDLIRILGAVVAACVCAALSVMKILRVQDPYLPEAYRDRKRRHIRSDLIRTVLDCAVVLVFLASDLIVLWFGLFPDTPLGFVTGFILLINITLVLSIPVDGCLMREQIRQSGGYGRFFLRQIINLFRIEIMMLIIWSCFLILEPTKTSFLFRTTVAFVISMLIVAALRAARNVRRKRQASETIGTDSNRQTDKTEEQHEKEENQG